MSFSVNVDPTNPGQFFACCGLLELADRLWKGAEARFEGEQFCIACEGMLTVLLDRLLSVPLELVDESDIYSSPARLGDPFNLTLDWWQDNRAGGTRLKPWAGTMQSVRIAVAMRAMFTHSEARTEHLFAYATVVADPDDAKKKVEPFYFDARRKENAHPRDIGFSPNEFSMTTVAHPAVEFLCLVGLQRARPCPTKTPRVFDYFTWSRPCQTSILPAAVCGLLGDPAAKGFRFENAFRTGQRKHKAFAPASPLFGDLNE
jgi:CRISPR-associated protein Csb3